MEMTSPSKTLAEEKLKQCTRCYCWARELYHHEAENEMGEKVEFELCWDCDFDVLNGGDIFEDSWEIEEEREEEDYLFDPINNPKPSWM